MNWFIWQQKKTQSATWIAMCCFAIKENEKEKRIKKKPKIITYKLIYLAARKTACNPYNKADCRADSAARIAICTFSSTSNNWPRASKWLFFKVLGVVATSFMNVFTPMLKNTLTCVRKKMSFCIFEYVCEFDYLPLQYLFVFKLHICLQLRLMGWIC